MDRAGEAGGRPVVVDASLVDDCVGILVGAFYDDPLWSWAFPDGSRRREQHAVVWRLMVEGAIRYPWTWLSSGAAATSVWIPPGGTELDDEHADSLEDVLADLLGAGADRVLGALAALEGAHPHRTPHFYLSLLGTDPARRGHGYGLALLADNLREIDALGMPAYLESSNPANVPLYARHGFVPVGVATPPGGPDVVTMWREPQPLRRP
jgi:GNAT superfamily N-acetyltransferase